MKLNKGIALLLILCTFSLGLVYAGSFQQELKRLEEEHKLIEKMLQDVDQSRQSNEKEQTDLERDIIKLEREVRSRNAAIDDLSLKIDETEEAIQLKEVEIADKEVELALAIEEVDFQTERMNKRLRAMYKSGSFGYLEVLLGSEDFADLLTRMDKVQLLLNYDQEMLLQLELAQRAVELAKAQLEEAKEALEVHKDALLVHKETIEYERTQLRSALSVLNQKKSELLQNHKALLNQLKLLNEEADNVTEMIKKVKLRAQYVGGVMQWPLPLDYVSISSPFGQRRHPILGEMLMHTGIDIPAPSGTPVYAAQSGDVIYSGWLGSYGMVIMLDHGGGIVTLYAHNSALHAKTGTYVKKGDKIASVGSTGRSTGNHLHFEVRVNGDFVEPLEYVKGQ